MGEIFNIASVDYSKKEITPYIRKDGDYYEYIPFGPDNLFPQALALFSRLSPNHRGVLVSKRRYSQGDGIIGLTPDAEKWIATVNHEGQNLNEVQKRLWTDNHTFGNEWIELISDKKGSFLFLNHIDSTKCRLSMDLKEVIIHPDWNNFTDKTDKLCETIALYPQWSEDTEKKGIYRSVYHKFDYEPEFTYYGVVSYISAKDSIQIDFKTNKWNLARLVNEFRISGLLSVPVKDAEEAAKVKKEIAKFIGEGNQGKVLSIQKARAAEGQKAEEPTFTPITSNDNGSWLDLHKQSLSDIIMGHGWFRALCSIPDNTGFDTQRILNEYNVALPSILEAQNEYIALYQKLYKEVTGKDIELQFKNSPPLQTDKYHYIWEMREKKGLDFDPKDPEQNKIILT